METLVQDEAALVARAADGSEHAFRTLYRQYVRPVYWVAHGLLGDAGDAEDVTQETFVTAWQKLQGFTLAGQSLLPWLVTICRFNAANRLRARRKTEHASLSDNEAAERLPSTISVDDQVISAELADTITRAVSTLTPLDQMIFKLCAVEGYAYDAAATELGVTNAVVRNRLSRVRKSVRTSLQTMES